MGTQDENNQGESIFLLQFLNVLFMADTCAKFEKKTDSTCFLREVSLAGISP